MSQNIFILGSAYCGSTFLGNCLNAHSEIFAAGEVSSLFPEFPLGVKNGFCPLCAVKQQPCSIWSQDIYHHLSNSDAGDILSKIRKTVGVPIVVDGSKFPAWMDTVVKHQQNKEEVNKAIVLARSPFAFYHSVKRREGYSPGKAKKQWLGIYERAFAKLDSLSIPYHFLKFEDFLVSPERKLKELCSFLNIEFQQAMLNFWQVYPHALCGNASAYMGYEEYAKNGQFANVKDEINAQKYQEQCFDITKAEMWKHEISVKEYKKIANCKAVVELCEKFGYDFIR